MLTLTMAMPARYSGLEPLGQLVLILMVSLSWVIVQVREYRKLFVLEFDSTRKRMSVVVRYPSGRVLLVTKGAESSVLPRCVTGTQIKTIIQDDFPSFVVQLKHFVVQIS